jgi:hypothetical protein
MNLQIFGIVIIVLVAIGYIAFSSRGRMTKPGKAIFGIIDPLIARNGGGSKEDIVDLASQAVVDGSEVIGKERHFPGHLQLWVAAHTATVLEAKLVSFHSQLIEVINAKATALGRRNGETFDPLQGLVIHIRIGAPKVLVSFTPFEQQQKVDVTGQAAEKWPAEPNVSLRPEPPRSTPHALPPTVAPRRLAATEPHHHDVTVRATIGGKDPISVTAPVTAGPLVFSLGRDPSNTLVLPNLPGVSANHATLTFVGGALYVTDVSTYGTWVETGNGWEKLVRNQSVLLPVASRLSLDADRSVVVSIEDGSAL